MLPTMTRLANPVLNQVNTDSKELSAVKIEKKGILRVRVRVFSTPNMYNTIKPKFFQMKTKKLINGHELQYQDSFSKFIFFFVSSVTVFQDFFFNLKMEEELKA